MLPFTEEVFFSVFGQYNEAIWPAQIVAYALGLAAVLFALSPSPPGNRLISGILTLAWLWTGIAYHGMYFGTVNIAAPGFALAFLLEALLLIWTGLLRDRLTYRLRTNAFGWGGLGLTVYAMAIYPLTAWLAGHSWPKLATFGLAPCPVTIFTVGMLLLIEGRTPLHLMIIPLFWSLIGGSAVWLLHVPEDLALPLAGVGGFCLVLWKNQRLHKAAAA